VRLCSAAFQPITNRCPQALAPADDLSAHRLAGAARRLAAARHLLVRSGAALAILGLGAWLYLMMRRDSPPHQIAKGLFWTMTGGAVFYCLLSGVWFTADA